MYCFLDCLLYKYEKRALYVRFIWTFEVLDYPYSSNLRTENSR